ncbi:MAG: phosphate-binding protein, partial [Bacteroidales bacterium]|nr:phosphate-binding protein [Bacteroidales bacterium]
MKRFLYLAGVFLIGAVLISSCKTSSSNKSTEHKLTGNIKIDGSSTVFPVTEAVAEEFRVEQPDVKVTIGVSG